MLAVTPRACETKRTARIERASPGGAPVLFRLSYVRMRARPAGLEPASAAVAGQRSLH